MCRTTETNVTLYRFNLIRSTNLHTMILTSHAYCIFKSRAMLIDVWIGGITYDFITLDESNSHEKCAS